MVLQVKYGRESLNMRRRFIQALINGSHNLIEAERA